MKIHTVLHLPGFAPVALGAGQYLPSSSGGKGRDGLFTGPWTPSFVRLGQGVEVSAVYRRGFAE